MGIIYFLSVNSDIPIDRGGGGDCWVAKGLEGWVHISLRHPCAHAPKNPIVFHHHSFISCTLFCGVCSVYYKIIQLIYSSISKATWKKSYLIFGSPLHPPQLKQLLASRSPPLTMRVKVFWRGYDEFLVLSLDGKAVYIVTLQRSCSWETVTESFATPLALSMDNVGWVSIPKDVVDMEYDLASMCSKIHPKLMLQFSPLALKQAPLHVSCVTTCITSWK